MPTLPIAVSCRLVIAPVWPTTPVGWPSLKTLSVATRSVPRLVGAITVGAVVVSPGRTVVDGIGPGAAVGAPSITSGPAIESVMCGWAGKASTGCVDAGTANVGDRATCTGTFQLEASNVIGPPPVRRLPVSGVTVTVAVGMRVSWTV